MQKIRLNARGWSTETDVYSDLLVALRSPRWHSQDLDALWESMSAGDVNGRRAPFHIIVVGTARVSDDVRALLGRLENLFHDLSGAGVDVRLSLYD